MAKLIYKSFQNYIRLEECPRDKLLHTSSLFDRTIGLFDNGSTNGATKLLEYYNKSKSDKDITLDNNINPYIISINDIGALYLGDDLPVVKNKTSKTITKHLKAWTNLPIMFKINGLYKYYYLEVNDNNKLFIFKDISSDIYGGEIIKNFSVTKNTLFLESNNIYEASNYIAKLDYTDERYNELLNEKLAKEEEIRKQKEELEILKRTPGYCCKCGDKCPNGPVPYPIQSDYGETRMVWLCRSCYYNILQYY